MPSSAFEPASFACDRRLSRAAREIVKRRIVPLLHPRDVTAPLADILRQYIQDASTCILHPDRDVLLQDELISRRIPAGSVRLSPTKNLPHWFECGVCGKQFLTPYYLDLHLETAKHSSSQGVCPAVSYCHVLGGCHDVALELEPFYGRGSGGAGPDAPQVRQLWSRQARSCNEHELADSVRPACQQVMNDCFAPDTARDLIVGVCDTLTCHNRLHQLAGHVVRHVHSWQREWEEHHNHKVGWMGAAVVVILVLWYVFAFGIARPSKPTTRLLSKKPSSQWRQLGKPVRKAKIQ